MSNLNEPLVEAENIKLVSNISEQKIQLDGKEPRKLYTNVTIEFIANVDTKSETFDTRFFIRYEWEPTQKEKKDYEKKKKEKEKEKNEENNEEKQGEEKEKEKEKGKDKKDKKKKEEEKLEDYFKCPELRYPNAKEFDIIKDDGIKYDSRTNKLKGGYLINATLLEKLELRNFPLDIQHFSINIEIVDITEEFIFCPRIQEKGAPNRPRVNSNERFIPKNKFIRLRSENVILADFHLKHILAEIAESKEENAAQRARKHSILFISIIMRRVAEAYIWRLGLFLFILCGCGLATWSVESIDNRLNMQFTLLLTMVALQMVVNSIVPNIPYLTLLDKYTILSFFFVFLLVLETSFSGVEKYYNGSADSAFFWIFLIVFVLSHIYFYFYCNYKLKTEELNKITHCRHERDEFFEDDEHLKAYDECSIDAEQECVKCNVNGNKYYDTILNEKLGR